MSELNGKKIAIIATNGFEDSELTSPREAVEAAGATTEIISTESGEITGKNGTAVRVDVTSADAQAGDYDGLILPGGTGNADAIRLDADAVSLVKKLREADTPVAVICHGGWILTEADAIKGVTLTSFPSLKTDLSNAGATWVDEEVVVDQGFVSSRTPDDLPAFNKALVEEFAK